METVGWIHWENHKYCNTLSRRHGNHQQWLNGWNKQKKCGYWTKHETARIVSRQTSQRHQNTPRRTRRRVDGHSQTDGHRDGRTGGGRGDERRSNHRRRREIGVKAERNSERVKEGEEWGGGEKRQRGTMRGSPSICLKATACPVGREPECVHSGLNKGCS